MWKSGLFAEAKSNHGDATIDTNFGSITNIWILSPSKIDFATLHFIFISLEIVFYNRIICLCFDSPFHNNVLLR